MAGVAKVTAKMSIGGDEPFEVAFAQSVTKWTGKRHMTLATAITDQSLIDIGGGGITTINQFMIVSSEAVSVKFGTAGSNVAMTLLPNAPLLLSGVVLTALSLSNTSGNTAQIDYSLSGI